MKHLLLLFVALFTINTAYAEDLTFNGTVAGTCTISVTQAGELDLNGLAVGTTTVAKAFVTNNEAGAFNLVITPPTDFTTKPNSFTGNSTLSSSYDLSGVNNIADVTGFINLANAGTDEASVDLTGTVDQPFTAGTYSAVTVLTCVAP